MAMFFFPKSAEKCEVHAETTLATRRRRRFPKEYGKMWIFLHFGVFKIRTPLRYFSGIYFRFSLEQRGLSHLPQILQPKWNCKLFRKGEESDKYSDQRFSHEVEMNKEATPGAGRETHRRRKTAIVTFYPHLFPFQPRTKGV